MIALLQSGNAWYLEFSRCRIFWTPAARLSGHSCTTIKLVGVRGCLEWISLSIKSLVLMYFLSLRRSLGSNEWIQYEICAQFSYCSMLLCILLKWQDAFVLTAVRLASAQILWVLQSYRRHSISSLGLNITCWLSCSQQRGVIIGWGSRSLVWMLIVTRYI